jgi:hypothetical protein
MQPPLPSLTQTWHNDSYPEISPDNPKLSKKGQTIIITGAVSITLFTVSTKNFIRDINLFTFHELGRLYFPTHDTTTI